MIVHITEPVVIDCPCVITADPENTDYVAAGYKRLFPGDKELFTPPKQSIVVERPGQTIFVREL